MNNRRFPVLVGQSRLPQSVRARWPRTVPWTFVEQFHTQIQQNHDQTLERLAQRGGLGPDELWLAAHGQPTSRFKRTLPLPSEEACGEWLIAEMAKLGEGPS